MLLATLLVALAALGATPHVQAASVGVLGHWPFDDVSDGRVAGVGAGPAATVHGATTCDGAKGKALRFDGKDDYVALGDLGEHAAVTVAFWLRVAPAYAPKGFAGLVTSDAWDPGMLHVSFKAGVVDVYLHLGKKARGRLTSAYLADGAWHHIAVVADAEDGRFELYHNGVLACNDTIRDKVPAIKLPQQVVGREDGTRYLKGAIDEVMIAGRALAESEIRALCPGAAPPPARDWRNIRTGRVIPDEGYCDQPYVVITKQGHWLCTMTTGTGHEGQGGQHVVSTISRDRGRTWSDPVDIEPADGPEASWVMPLITPSGRVYAFYDYNGERINYVGKRKNVRADMLGWYCYRYSDDGGRSWSKQRYRLPVRVTKVDRNNDYQGKVQILWGIGKPITQAGTAYLAFTKIGKYMLDESEGWVFRSDNVLTEPDVDKLVWQLLPDGDVGIRSPELGSIQSEQNLVPLSRPGHLFCMYRTTTGHPACCYSRDGAHTWTTPVKASYTPGGRLFKHPRACPRIWKTHNGRYLFWMHNHGGKTFKDRNPAWICGGREIDGKIHWSQPEILFYDPEPSVRMSYPDLIEEDGRYWITETQKSIARVHEIDATLFEAVWAQHEVKTVAKEGLVLELSGKALATKTAAMPKLPHLGRGGLAIDLAVRFDDLSVGQVLLDARDEAGKGITVQTTANEAVGISLSDGQREATWDCDPGLLETGTLHRVTFIVDGGPKIITVVVDEQLCDGGAARPFGWGRFNASLGDINGSKQLRIAPSFKGKLGVVRLYDRYLRTSEAIGNQRAPLP